MVLALAGFYRTSEGEEDELVEARRVCLRGLGGKTPPTSRVSH